MLCLLIALLVVLTPVQLVMAKDLERFQDSISGIHAVFSSDDEYSSASQPFNLRYDYKPFAITYPSTTEEVATLIKAAAEQNISTVARGGGHSYTALGLGGQDGALVIDMSEFKSISVDEKSGKASIGGGALLGDVALALNDRGRGMPHGACPYVGVGGHFSLGGYGFMSRLWGLSVDTVGSLDVVMPDGTAQHIDEESDSELYWAMLGAGTSFGIITEYGINTLEAPAKSSYHQYAWNFTAEKGVEALQIWQEWLKEDLSPKMGVQIDLFKGPERGMLQWVLKVAYFGPEDEYQTAIQPLLSKLPGDSENKSTIGTYIEIIKALAGDQPLDTSTEDNYDDTFYVKSLMTPEFTQDATKAYILYLANEGYDSDTAWFVQQKLYGGRDSAINAPASDATAFAWRDSFYAIQFYASSSSYAPPFPDDGFSFLDDMVSTVTDNMDLGSAAPGYINYVDDRLKNPQQVYYGGNSDRLSELKTNYDPQNLFRFPSAIRPA